MGQKEPSQLQRLRDREAPLPVIHVATIGRLKSSLSRWLRSKHPDRKMGGGLGSAPRFRRLISLWSVSAPTSAAGAA
jgi:hypothetical protein